MGRNRIEAFSDGVIAIVLTIMVLELKVPHGDKLADLLPLAPVFLSYLLSFIFVGIYWNNHHHLFHTAQHVDGRVLWANLHLLFWLSLVPFVTGWMGENHFHRLPVAIYGVVMIGAASAYYLLTQSLLRRHGRESSLARAVGGKMKENLSLVIYALGVAAAFLVSEWVALIAYSVVSVIWLVPDRRIEAELGAVAAKTAGH